ncbi:MULTISPECIES: ASCH domain-containing protein [unclassified Mesorhizobium]|uniref:ASCH domain-containing protein n=1 Tax=unclassified Mesorhizobium TaxID=325217 RepID=UPI00112885F2|nr:MULTISPECIES: ASCH domain-containing protein [unclassified Mesorhizobium]MCA0027385.1 ASCH domain-containing protein [Mesorhizobium sp. B263B1A]TPJ98655.1 ASCH domain-containing protein [Mesorhizobium sp. B2-5-12]TPK28818.1 ASCH domain-containing protein [Mesorhizobium sp. B2-5-6]
MKAVTIWQPWATLIIAGVKPYEFRSWPAPGALRGQRIAIHAGARPVRKAELADLIIRLRSPDAWSTALKPEALAMLERWHSNPFALPLASIVGTAVLGQPVRAFDIVSEFGAKLNDSDRDQHSNWAWPLTEIEPLKPIQPIKGLQGFWNWRPA